MHQSAACRIRLCRKCLWSRIVYCLLLKRRWAGETTTGTVGAVVYSGVVGCAAGWTTSPLEVALSRTKLGGYKLSDNCPQMREAVPLQFAEDLRQMRQFSCQRRSLEASRCRGRRTAVRSTAVPGIATRPRSGSRRRRLRATRVRFRVQAQCMSAQSANLPGDDHPTHVASAQGAFAARLVRYQPLAGVGKWRHQYRRRAGRL